jgi:hypothetical protein
MLSRGAELFMSSKGYKVEKLYGPVLFIITLVVSKPAFLNKNSRFCLSQRKAFQAL